MFSATTDTLSPRRPSRNSGEIRHGEAIADRADEIWGWNLPTGPARLQRRTTLLIRNADIKPEKKILELGCGTGCLTKFLAKTGAEIVALDLSPDLLTKAGTKELPENVTLQIGNAESLDFPNETFDAVVGSSVLHHVDTDIALGEIYRVLRPRGKIAFSEPNMFNPHIFIQKNIPWVKKLSGDSPDETAFFRWQLIKMLQRIGFDDIRVSPYDFLYPLTPKSLISPLGNLSKKLEQIPLLREIAGSLIIGAKKS